jgi:hypothetical protein
MGMPVVGKSWRWSDDGVATLLEHLTVALVGWWA